jgi:hypothetical protein
MLTNALFDSHPSFALCFTQSPSPSLTTLAFQLSTLNHPGSLTSMITVFHFASFSFALIFTLLVLFFFFKFQGGRVLVVKELKENYI